MNKIIVLLIISVVIVTSFLLQSKDATSFQIVLYLLAVAAMLVWNRWLMAKKLKVKGKDLLIRNFLLPGKGSISELVGVEMYIPFWQPSLHQRLFGLCFVFSNRKRRKTGPIFPEEYEGVCGVLRMIEKTNPKTKIDSFTKDFVENGSPDVFLEENYSRKGRVVSVLKGLGVALLFLLILGVVITLLAVILG